MIAFVAAAALRSVYADRRLPSAPAEVVIPQGLSVPAIAELLQRKGVIASTSAFTLYVRARHLGASIQADEYSFPSHESIRQVVDVLAAGGFPPAVWIGFPEGFTARQIAQRLQDERLVTVKDFMATVRRTRLTVAGARVPSLEGYLFPDTYLIPRRTSARAVAGLMTEQFFKRLPADYLKASHELGFSVPQIVTIASLVEREAKSDDERALMAGVYYNRLRIGMPLQVDATIEYALPLHKTALSFKDLGVASAYNSYTHAGLPPTPIANPGLKSLEAAFHPQPSDYLYYVYKGGGHHQFSRTLGEQEAAERRYLR
ncbi:MAG: endolytic transglycosylase MltG [Candidatus Eremiobacteraeota bacterium]|nr:endolytic transglycosylase MltG [Candidatus Eremiobacteraeota bacterium]